MNPINEVVLSVVTSFGIGFCAGLIVEKLKNKEIEELELKLEARQLFEVTSQLLKTTQQLVEDLSNDEKEEDLKDE